MKNRIKVYWLLLLVLLYTAGAVLSVGEAQARYVNTATWNTVVQPKETEISSDCLESVSAPKLTILLGTMPQEGCSVPFTITAGEAVSGKLNWTVDLPEYLSVQMHIGNTAISPETNVEIAAGDTITVVMTLIPAEHAYTEVREALNVSIQVTWSDTLRGTFLTQLSAVEEEEEPTEETEPSEPEETEPSEPEATEPSEPEVTEPTEPETTEPTEPEVTDPSEPDTTEPSEPEVTEPSEPEVTDPTEPIPAEETTPESEISDPSRMHSGLPVILRAPRISLVRLCVPVLPGRMPLPPSREYTILTEPPVTGPSDPVSDGTEETSPEAEPIDNPPDPTEDPAPQTEEPTNPSEPSKDTTEPSEPVEDPTDPSESAQEEPEVPSEPVEQDPPVQNPIVMEASGTVNSAAALPIQITAPEAAGPIRLGIASRTEPVAEEGEGQTVLENFPRYTRYSLDNGESYYMLYHEDMIALNPSQGEVLTVLLDLSHVNLENPRVILGAALQEGSEIATCAVTLIPESAQWAEFPDRILSVNRPLEIPISEQGQNFVLEYSLEMLTTIKSEDGKSETLTYVPVELTKDGLWAELITGETGTKLVISIGEKLPQAGTYRISFSWTHEETVCAEMQETIFINYSVYTESEQTGGAEQ